MTDPFTHRVIRIIAAIPEGRVASYGGIAALAGSPGSARQVVRILHTQSGKHDLPWHRVVNARGQIALKDPLGAEEQRLSLEAEGVELSPAGRVERSRFWQGLNSG